MRLCTIPDCTRPYYAKGRCRRHYEQWRDTTDEKPRCTIDGCSKPVKARGWCTTHYRQWLRGDTPHPIATACDCGPAEPTAPIAVHGGRWTPDEDAVVVAVSDIDDAARQLPHRTRWAIRKRRLRLEADGVTVTPIDHPYMPKNPKPRKAAA